MTSEGVRVQPIYEFQTLETYIFDFKKKAVMTINQGVTRIRSFWVFVKIVDGQLKIMLFFDIF